MRTIALLLLSILLLLTGVFVGFRLARTTSGSAETEAVVVSAELAQAAEDKIGNLKERRREARLTGPELTSLLVHRPEIWTLGALRSPVVRISGDTLSISGAVDPAVLPEVPGLRAVRRVLPDTTRVSVAGTLEPHAPGSALLRVASAEVLGLPFPSRFFPAIVERLGFPRGDGLPSHAFELPLPAGIRTAVVTDGVLLLTP